MAQSLFYSVAHYGASNHLYMQERTARALVSVQIQHPAKAAEVVEVLQGLVRWLKDEPGLLEQGAFLDAANRVYED